MEHFNKLYKNFDEYYERQLSGLLIYINDQQRDKLTNEQIDKLDAYILMMKMTDNYYFSEE